MYRVNIKFAAACAATLFSLPVAAADLTVVFKTVSNGKESTATEYFTTNKTRTTNDSSDVIMDLAAGRLTMIDNKKREYSEITVAEMQAAMVGANEQMAAARQKQEEAMKNMPPAVRERMAKMMPGGAGGMMSSIKVTPGTGTRKVAGYDCQQFIMTMGESMTTDLWTTTALQMPLEPSEIVRLQSMMSPMADAKSIASATEEFKKLRGFSLASKTTIKVMGRTIDSTREATDIKVGAIPAATFAVPAGYKKVESPMAKMAAKQH
jgi:Domain of unknown function (DUF4412)